VRWSARYEETVTFYRDAIGLPVLETFQARSALEVLIFFPNGPGVCLGHRGMRLAGGVLPRAFAE